MLRDIYLSAGSVGTFFIAIGMFVTFIGWWMAVTETVTREGLTMAWRVVLVLFMSLGRWCRASCRGTPGISS